MSPREVMAGWTPLLALAILLLAAHVDGHGSSRLTSFRAFSDETGSSKQGCGFLLCVFGRVQDAIASEINWWTLQHSWLPPAPLEMKRSKASHEAALNCRKHPLHLFGQACPSPVTDSAVSIKYISAVPAEP